MSSACRTDAELNLQGVFWRSQGRVDRIRVEDCLRILREAGDQRAEKGIRLLRESASEEKDRGG